MPVNREHRPLLTVLFLLGAAALLAEAVRDRSTGFLASGVALLLVARGVAFRRPVSHRQIGVAASVGLLAVLAVDAGYPLATVLLGGAVGAVLSRPLPPPAPGTPADRRRIGDLVDRTEGDPVAPFALRRDKSYLFSEDGRAAVGYRVRFGTAVVAGDPVGDRDAFGAVLARFAREADRAGWRMAAVAASATTLPFWQAHGLRAIPIGRDVVLDVATFTLQGRRFRNLRQAVSRTRNAGVGTEIVPERDLPDGLLAELEHVVRVAPNRDPERGFSMNLDGLLDGDHPGMLLAVARNRTGHVVAFHRYASTNHGRELSLDVPWRVPGAPNGVDERLVTDTVEWGRQRGVQKVSLAFAAFPELFASRVRSRDAARNSGGDQAKAQAKGQAKEQAEGSRLRRAGRAGAYWGTRCLAPLIRVEPLYRFLRKFHAFGNRRYVLLRPVDVFWSGAAMLTLEAGLRSPLPGRRRRAARVGSGPAVAPADPAARADAAYPGAQGVGWRAVTGRSRSPVRRR